MPIPTFNLHISGNVLAAYGAVLSTITATAQIMSYMRDRVNLRIDAQHDMKLRGDPRYAGMTLTMINVSNQGRRPVTVTNVSAYRLHPLKAFIIPDAMPRIPYELTEGKQLYAIFDQADVDLSTIECWTVSTATGKRFRVNVAPWHKRWVSRYRRKQAWRREDKEKAAKKVLEKIEE